MEPTAVPWGLGAVGDVAALGERRSDFDVVYRAEYVPLLRLAVLLVGNRAAAEDLVHDAFLRWHRHAGTVEHPKAYLRTTLINLCRNGHRGMQRESARLVRVAAGTATDAELVADAEMLELIDRLPFQQRATVVLRYWLGWSEADIAAALDCRPGTVKSAASRALARLREELSDAD